jgi:hypothetical protein
LHSLREKLRKWFYFSIHIKLWLALVVIGATVMGLGLGLVLKELLLLIGAGPTLEQVRAVVGDIGAIPAP